MHDEEFQTLLDRVRQNAKSDSTATQYVSKLKDFREWLDKPLEEVDVIDVENWLAALDERYNNASSVGKGRAALVAGYRELNKLIQAGRVDAEGWVRDSPPNRADYTPDDTDTYRSRETREDLEWLTPEEVNHLAQATERLRDELIVRLLFQTGARVSELCDIRLKDLDREERLITIRGKGRKNRTVGYQPSIDLHLDRWNEERRPALYYAEESEYLFPTSHSERITREAVARVVRTAAEEADLQHQYGESIDGVPQYTITPHVLRHSFAMAALDNGWDLHSLSLALGHESAEITAERYLHNDPDRVKAAYRDRGPTTTKYMG